MSISGFVIRIAITLCLFQLPLAQHFKVISYFDELLAATMALSLIAVTLKRKPIAKVDLAAFGCLVALALFGLICNLSSGVSRSAAAIVQDLVTVVKFFCCYFGAKYVFFQRDDCYSLLGFAVMLTRTIVLVAILCYILAYTGYLDMLSTSLRMGLRSYRFIYRSPGMLSQYCVLFSVILLADFSRPGGANAKWFFLMLGLLLWATTLRTRGFFMIVLILFLLFVVSNLALELKAGKHSFLRRLTSPAFLLVVGALAFVVGNDQLAHYFGEEATARSYLLEGGLRAFRDYFPMGTGFGTYGTEAAREYYSPLYSEYGLNAYWALGEDGTELTDTFWPAILAQFGAIGAVLYTIPLVIVLAQILRGTAANRHLAIAACTFVIYALTASIATGVFFSYTITDCIFLIGILMGCALSDAKKGPGWKSYGIDSSV